MGGTPPGKLGKLPVGKGGAPPEKLGKPGKPPVGKGGAPVGNVGKPPGGVGMGPVGRGPVGKGGMPTGIEGVAWRSTMGAARALGHVSWVVEEVAW